MTTFFTADHHFGHAKIISMCNRPFADIDAMNRALIENWNAVVAPDDTVHVVGDFAYKIGGNPLWEIFQALNGAKHLTIGNHDNIEVLRLPWASKPEHRRHLPDGDFVLDHYAGRTWFRSSRKSVQLFGHSHGDMPGNSQQLDVGVDCWDFRPVDAEQIRARLATLPSFRYAETTEGLKP